MLMSTLTSSQENTETQARQSRSSNSDRSVPTARVRQEPRKAGTSWQITNQILYLLPPVLLGLIILTAWYVSTASGRINPLILPAPGAVFTSLISGITTGLYLEHLLIT